MRLGREFIEALDTVAEERGLDMGVVTSAIEAALLSAYNRRYHPYSVDRTTEIKINHDTGDITISELRKVVEAPTNPDREISLSDALAIDPTAQLGSVLKIEKNPGDFGRIAAQTTRQIISQRLGTRSAR